MSDGQTETEELYFVRRRGKIDGPWNIGKLKSEVKLRRLSRIHEVSDDKENWSRAETLTWLFPKTKVHQKSAHLDSAYPGSASPAQLSQSDLVEQSDVVANVDTNWFLGIDGREIGPMGTAEVKHKIITGETHASDLIWQAGYPDWIPISHLPAFAPLFAPHPNRDSQAILVDRDQESFGSPQLIEDQTVKVSSMATSSMILGLVAFPCLTIASLFLGIISIRYIYVGLWVSVPIGVIAAIFGLLSLQNLLRPDNLQIGKSRAAIGLITGASAALGFTLVQLFYLIFPLVSV